jgi:hypothetical protein
VRITESIHNVGHLKPEHAEQLAGMH